ncbi:hypothetical protein OHB05_01845 [Streptomyces sp. NBC_00638]|uniref:hypothetical protein n=1 Tax=unclassified Streptomyces TaxID=2593676 RepID=UPI00224D566F|nr:hypothetical protein [Streptomyces sp. NBC_00638]MCX5001373.1 hypothetical protein [Streptomyces sp. NBC_00638]
MTTTDPGLLTALDTLTSAAKAAPPGTVAVWADIWAVAVRGLEAALDADVRAFAAGGMELSRLPAADQFIETARAQASVLADLASLATEEEIEGTWGVCVPAVPAVPGGGGGSADGQLHCVFHLFQAAEAVLTDDHGAPAIRGELVADSTHYLDLARHYLELMAAKVG